MIFLSGKVTAFRLVLYTNRSGDARPLHPLPLRGGGKSKPLPRRVRARGLPTAVARIERSEIREQQAWMAFPGFASLNPGYNDERKLKREAERRQTRDPTVRAEAGAVRVQRDALACRRSTAALAAANERHRSAPAARFLGRGRSARPRWFERSCAFQRALPAPSCPSPASVLADRSSCRSGALPKPPRRGVTKPARRNRPRSASRSVTGDDP